MAIKIPNEWEPRPHQLPLLRALDNGVKRAVAVWHRRAGKDSVSLNFSAKEAIKKKAVYWHMLPTAAQARKVVWDGIDKNGRRIIDQVFPHEIRKSTNVAEMRIELVNGSIWQLVGSDNYNALVGANPCGVVFSEFSLNDPRAWDYIRPILRENQGWAIFIFTPRGKNHAYDLYLQAKNNPEWFCQLLTVRDTGIISEQDVQSERSAGMSEAMIQQEFYCSFESALEGAYFGSMMNDAGAQGRITKVPYDPSTGVITAWDLGVGDSTAIWFAQMVGREIHIIDYYENSGESLAHYINVINDKKYSYTAHYAPHDIQARELGTGKTRFEVAQQHGLTFQIVPRASVEDGIEAGRVLIPRCWFDEDKCRVGIEALKSYRKAYNDKMKAWSSTPLHDWSSHGADAFKYLALSVDRQNQKLKPITYPKLGIV